MKIAIYIFTAIIIIVLLAKMLSPGSYHEAERYQLKTSEKSLIEATLEFKNRNRRFSLPDSLNIKDGREGDSLWYDAYFYFPEDTTIVYSWIRQMEFQSTTIAFVSVKLNNSDPRWMCINSDFSRAENKRQIARFEKEIIEPLHKIVGDK